MSGNFDDVPATEAAIRSGTGIAIPPAVVYEPMTFLTVHLRERRCGDEEREGENQKNESFPHFLPFCNRSKVATKLVPTPQNVNASLHLRAFPYLFSRSGPFRELPHCHSRYPHLHKFC
jgi:hypothetical protein